MFKIQTLNKIDAEGLQRFSMNNYEVASEFSAPDAILVRSAKMHDLELATSLKAIGRAGAGVNNIPIDKCTDKGIVVFNTPGANANAVKELVIASMLLSSRNLVDGINWAKTLIGQGGEVRQARERRDRRDPEREPERLPFLGGEPAFHTPSGPRVSRGSRTRAPRRWHRRRPRTMPRKTRGRLRPPHPSAARRDSGSGGGSRAERHQARSHCPRRPHRSHRRCRAAPRHAPPAAGRRLNR